MTTTLPPITTSGSHRPGCSLPGDHAGWCYVPASIPPLEPIKEMPVGLDPAMWPPGAFLKSDGPCKYDITFQLLPSGEYSAIDRETFDGAPDARYHCIGVGKTKEEALAELLDKIAEAAAGDNSCGRCGHTPKRCTCLKPADNE